MARHRGSVDAGQPNGLGGDHIDADKAIVCYNFLQEYLSLFRYLDAEDSVLGWTEYNSSTIMDQDRHHVPRGKPFVKRKLDADNLAPLQPEQLHAFGLLATKGATKAFQLVLQAYILKHLMFEGKMAKKAAK